MIIQVKRETSIQDAVPSKIYLDGAFFAHGLENKNYMIPAGRYSVTGKRSEKFGANKIYLNVQDRSGIMFHGGNTTEDTRGCILVGANRNGATISGDKSNELFKEVNNAANAGEGVVCVVSNAFNWPIVLTVAGVVGLVFLATR